AAAPIDAISSEPRDGSRRKSLTVPVNRLPMLCVVPHGEVSRLVTWANAGTALATVAATTVAHVHNILTIEVLVIAALPASARIPQDATVHRGGGNMRPLVLPTTRTVN